MINYRQAEEKDLSEISTVLTQAYKNYCFYSETIGKTFKDEKSYEEFLYHLFYIYVKTNLKKQICMVGIINESIVSCAGIKNPSIKHSGIYDYIAAGGLSLFKYSSPINIFRFLKFSEEGYSICSELKPDAWYLDSLVVSPNYQGKNLGSQMINDCIKPYVINNGGTELSLITNSEINRQFYIKNGFEEIDESIIIYKNTKLKNWSYSLKLV